MRSIENCHDPLRMRQVIPLTLFFPLIPHASEAIVNSNAILMALSVHGKLILVVRAPLGDVSGQIRNHAELHESHIHPLRNENNIVPVCIKIVNQRQAVGVRKRVRILLVFVNQFLEVLALLERGARP